MIDAATVRRLALALPEVMETSRGGDHIAFEVLGGKKGLVWTFMRRIHPKKARIPDPTTVAIRCPIERKEMLVEAAPDRFFDDAHYRGFPAVMVRMAAIDEDEFAALLRGAWRMMAPPALVEAHPEI